MSLLGLDIGTTGCKAIAFNLGGRTLASAYREYPLLHPQPGWSELDIHDLWTKVTEVIEEANSRLSSDPVAALSVSCQGEATAPIDARGEPLYNFSVSFDHRTVAQAQWWRTQMDAKEIFRITGMPLHAMHSIQKILWFKEHLPKIYARTAKFLCVEDYVNFRLTGEYAIDWSLAARTMAFNVIAKDWSAPILAKAGVDRALLPKAHPSGTPVGKVSAKLARELGFGNDVLVATGGHDQPCGALGAGIIDPGVAMNATGTSDVICPAFNEPLLTDAMLTNNYCCYPHVNPSQYVSIAFNLTGGLLLRWYRDVLCETEQIAARQSGRDVYETIIEAASDHLRSLYFLPHFVGAGTPYLDSHSRGAVVGLTIDTTKEDLSRAVLDSINYEAKVNIERMNQSGCRIDQIRAIGGGAKSARWLQMKADAFGMPVVSMKASEAAALGAAILGGIATGCFGSIREAVERMVEVQHTYEPDAAKHRQYEGKYREYREIYPALRELNCLLSREGNA